MKKLKEIRIYKILYRIILKIKEGKLYFDESNYKDYYF